MRIGCPKEIKPQEGRVGLTPAGVDAFVRAGHTVYMEQGAGPVSYTHLTLPTKLEV